MNSPLHRCRAALLALVGLAYPLVIVAVVNGLAATGWPGYIVLNPAEVRIAALVLAVVSAFNVATPWQRRSWPAAAEGNADRDVAGRLMVVGFPFNAAPASYGLLLYILGANTGLTVFFATASLLAALAWAAGVLLATRRGRTDY